MADEDVKQAEETEASAPEQEEKREIDVRQQAVDAFRASRHAELNPEEGAGEEEPPVEPEVEATAEEPEPEKPEEASPEELGAAEEDLVEIKVYGRSEKVTKDELVRRAQKASAAEVRLQEANALIQELRTAKPPAPKVETKAGPEKKEEKKAPVIETPVLSAEAADKIARKLQVGSEDDARSAIQELYSEAVKNAITTLQNGRDSEEEPEAPAAVATPPAEDMNRLIDARLRQEKEETLLNNDIQAVTTEFPDVMNDPNLVQIAVSKTHELRAQDLINSGRFTEESCQKLLQAARVDANYAQLLAAHHRNLELNNQATPRLELFRQAAEAAKSYLVRAEEKDDAEEKKAQKRSLPQQPKGATKRNASPAPPTRQERNAMYVKGMMKDRGTLPTARS